MRDLGRRLGVVLRAGDLVLLTGPLGAGKTTLTTGIGDALGVRGPVTSPTFVLARTHPAPNGRPPLVHVDAYRLRSAAELDDLDLDYDGAVVVVEWGEGLLEGVNESLLEIRIERPAGAHGDEDDEDEAPEPRTVEVRATGPRWAAGAPLLG
ncbi:tRNA (adenosine(37)-N6)-threonylcarbamoyltransferase complex ATPase subunit type 1 TsaE [Amnibacterium sp. CER49]|uniref:tRNA (adenosine(37)-N6)-threonylcarbamoyltransferase complex ATPase subunit type 1 TsaE n=1 Tax=Amnibacterium sp. CER49 TaxID=3039161 RepID=UPI002446EA22|nr:tRNA (adenosine(37)-N6)-threonylcarbamoyltransferase complex ATPase subunit type 1 TsaE [Amnibacterium sp. CER49]MDH2443941.1 tRNA (adenosine(37)-N6)-threonylcarbamoyltransferase complex ATPase subunit type 1 TsaE [Amnibacterium sp. CER49]